MYHRLVIEQINISAENSFLSDLPSPRVVRVVRIFVIIIIIVVVVVNIVIIVVEISHVDIFAGSRPVFRLDTVPGKCKNKFMLKKY